MFVVCSSQAPKGAFLVIVNLPKLKNQTHCRHGNEKKYNYKILKAFLLRV
jgi:hypothetical protein